MRALVVLVLLLPGSVVAEELPVYPGAVHTRIGDDLLIAGERYRIAWFVTSDPMREVAEHFFQAWRSRGHPTMVDGDLVHEGVVSAFSTREGIQRAVVLRLHEGRTFGFTVLRDLWSRLEPGTEPPPLEGTLLRHDLVSNGARGGARHHGAVVAMDLARARARVEQRLAARGFRRLRERSGVDGGRRQLWLEHASAGARIVTVLAELEPGRVTVLETEESVGEEAGPGSTGGGTR